MKITMYELLGLVKDGKAPERILYDNYIWSWTGDDYQTILKNEKEQFLITGMYYTWVTEFLNDTVEIIEEPKKIEKIKSNGDEFYSDYIETWISKNKTDAYCEFLMNKINELIDEINNLKEK